MKLGEAMYKGAASRCRRRRPVTAMVLPAVRRPKEGVVDADFEEVDENRKGGAA